MPSLVPQQIAEVNKIFSDYLKKKGLRRTPERYLIFEEVYGSEDHFDADELYVRLKRKDVAVSRATVYNTLDLLIACNLVVRHQFGDKQAKYEPSFHYWQHDHLICSECNEVFEFCDPRMQGIREMVAEIFQFEIENHSLQINGRCLRNDCPNRERTKASTEAA